MLDQAEAAAKSIPRKSLKTNVQLVLSLDDSDTAHKLQDLANDISVFNRQN